MTQTNYWLLLVAIATITYYRLSPAVIIAGLLFHFAFGAMWGAFALPQ